MITSEQLMPISFVLLQLQLACYDDDLSPMDNNNTVIFLLHVMFNIIYHREISLAPAVTVGKTEGAMDSTSVFLASSFAYNFVRK